MSKITQLLFVICVLCISLIYAQSDGATEVLKPSEDSTNINSAIDQIVDSTTNFMDKLQDRHKNRKIREMGRDIIEDLEESRATFSEFRTQFLKVIRNCGGNINAKQLEKHMNLDSADLDRYDKKKFNRRDEIKLGTACANLREHFVDKLTRGQGKCIEEDMEDWADTQKIRRRR